MEELDADISWVNLATLIELTIASGISNLSRLKDLADVIELIRVHRLELQFVNQLKPYVHSEFTRLWETVMNNPVEE